MIGADALVIAKAEDRQKFRSAMQKIGLESPMSVVVTNIKEARDAMDKIGLPLIIRPSFTLGGLAAASPSTRMSSNRSYPGVGGLAGA